MASRIIALTISILIIVGLIVPAISFYEAYASTATDEGGVSCTIPKDADKIREIYQKKSDTVLSNWELESIDVGCGGSISATYNLPEFSDSSTTFRVYLQQNQPLQQIRVGDEEDPFPADFIEQRDISVAESISGIMSNYVFKGTDKEFANNIISFFYGTHSYFYVSAYKDFETCKSNFEVDGAHPELLFFSISNNADIDTIPLIKIAREHAKDQLQKTNSSTAGAMGIRSVSDASCGQTTVHTSSYMTDDSGIEPYSYTANIDIECDTSDTNAARNDRCPEEIQIVYGRNFQSPIAFNIINNNTVGDSENNNNNAQITSTLIQLEKCQGLGIPAEDCDEGTIRGKEISKTTNAWFYSTIVSIGIASAVAGMIAFVTLKRLW